MYVSLRRELRCRTRRREPVKQGLASGLALLADVPQFGIQSRVPRLDLRGRVPVDPHPLVIRHAAMVAGDL